MPRKSTKHAKPPETADKMDVVQALEALSTIADLEFEADVGVTQEHQILVRDRPLQYRTVHWVNQGNRKETVDAIRETFRVVLEYLREFYAGETPASPPTDQTIESVQNMMMLVGEAAEKLDRYTHLFKKTDVPSVTELKEYKDLQKFYRDTLMTQQEGESVLREIFAQTVATEVSKPAKVAYVGNRGLKDGKHVVLEMDSLRRDTEYELMLMRKVTGERFFSPKLLRNLRLVCDFGEAFGQSAQTDPLVMPERWLDRILQVTAEEIASAVHASLDNFYRVAGSKRDWELVSVLHRACMALFLASNPRNLMRNNPVKTCTRYFRDFQQYYRQALSSLDYNRLLNRDPSVVGPVSDSILELVHQIARALHSRVEGLAALSPIMTLLIQHGYEIAGIKQPMSIETASGALKQIWEVLGGIVRQQPAGPLRKTLLLIQRDRIQAFDPYLLQNVPSRAYDLFAGGRRVAFLRLPCPTWQEYIHRAVIAPEFKTFLESCLRGHTKRRHLLINMQDATSWKEHARCHALVELAEHEVFSDALSVVNLNRSSDFYYQNAPYDSMADAHLFKETLKEQFRGEGTGYRFPARCNKLVLGGFLDQITEGVHELFFENRNALTRVERRDYIELVQLFSVLRAIEVVEPTSCSFTCKDGVDTGAGALAEFYALIRTLRGEAWNWGEIEYTATLLFGPALMHRERLVEMERYDHCISIIGRVEETMRSMGKEAFNRRFKMFIDRLFEGSIREIHLERPEPVAGG